MFCIGRGCGAINFGIGGEDMEEWRLSRQIGILERMETISNWMAAMERPGNRRDRLVQRYVRGVLRRRYRRYKKLGKQNIEAKTCVQDGVRVLRCLKHYESRASKEVLRVFKDSRLYGAGLELGGIFGRYGDVHGCKEYKEFLRRVQRVDVKGEGFRYLRYLDELSEYLRGFMKVKYFGRYMRRWASTPRVVSKGDGRSLCRSKGAEDWEGFAKVYCVKCEREISRNVLGYHLGGKKHKDGDGDEVLYCAMSVEKAEGLVREGFRALEKERKYSVSLFSRRSKQERVDVPRWRHRLRDLDILFECGICGYSGYGRDGFDRHFGEEAHARGVRKYGVEYSPKLRGITRADVLIGMRGSKEDSDRYSEEFEDGEGNVFDRRTYEDLVRNNLI